jgi:hypothetical protein
VDTRNFATAGAAGQGGGVWLESGALTLQADTITNNQAKAGAGGTGPTAGAAGQSIGGGVYNNSTAPFSILITPADNMVISKNHATTNPNTYDVVIEP